jgi:hypothetical protein
MSHPLLDTALLHHEDGRPIISVTPNKKPYYSGWDNFLTRPQSEEELRQQFQNGVHGLALVLYPGCPFGVLDYDGPHAQEAWQTTGLELPETARNYSRSGYTHLFFRMPPNAPTDLKRGIRLVSAPCDCQGSDGEPKPCGVDFLVNGYVILPPTPGYREDPDHPLESAALMPQAVIDLALKKQKAEKNRLTGDAEGKVNRGERKATACSLAGTMRKRGMSLESIRAALKADNEARFRPPLDAEELDDIMKSAATWQPGEESQDGKKQKSQADILLELALSSEGVDFFHTATNEPFIIFYVNDHRECWPVRSRATRRWLTKNFYRSTGKAPSSEPMQNALGVLDAKAIYDGEERDVHLRTARHDGALYYDLADQQWRSVRIDEDGWEVIEESPVYFRRYDQTAAQVEPKHGGSLNQFWDFINISDESDRRLIEAYLVVGLIPNIPRPIADFHGGQGSAKTTTCNMLKKILDPGEASALKAKDETEFIQGLAHNYAVVLENVSYITNWLSDLLCRAVTGEGFSKRQLYTDEEDIIFKFRRLIMINGIGVTITAPDLLDRALIISLDEVDATKRRQEAELWGAFEKSRPALLGAVFTALSGAIREYPNITSTTLPRMADFARWGMAANVGRGKKAKTFLEDYDKNVSRQNEVAILESVVATVLIDWFSAPERKSWEGLPQELHAQLKEHAVNMKIAERKFPASPSALTNKLKRVKPNLATVGMKIDWDRTNKARKITIAKIG